MVAIFLRWILPYVSHIIHTLSTVSVGSAHIYETVSMTRAGRYLLLLSPHWYVIVLYCSHNRSYQVKKRCYLVWSRD